MTILVTGGAGFIGSALVRALVADGEQVVTIDKLTYAGNIDNLAAVAGNSRHRFVKADICDRAAMKSIFADCKPHAVYHLAAESHVDRSIANPAAFVETNVLGTAILLEVALDYWRSLDAAGQGRFRFLQVSTDEVYGELGDDGLFAESSPYRPNSPYSASKAGADHLARAWHHTYGLPVQVSNCSNNFGPFQFPEKFIPVVIINALAGKPLPVYGQGVNVRDWLHVDDHVAALRTIASSGAVGETYLIGARSERRNIDMVRTICQLLDKRRPHGAPHEKLISFVTDRLGHDNRYAVDPTKIESTLGWHPRHNLMQGLAETVDWYIDNQAWCANAIRHQSEERQKMDRGAV